MIVWDDEIYDNIFMNKSLMPLSCFRVHSGYPQVVRVMRYMISVSASVRRDHYHLIRDMFKNSSREDTNVWDYLINYSARTALDLWFQAKNYPEGSEVLMTAISTEGIIEIIRGK